MRRSTFSSTYGGILGPDIQYTIYQRKPGGKKLQRMVNSGPISDRILFCHLRNCWYTIRLSRIGNTYLVRIGNKYPVRIGNTYPARIRNMYPARIRNTYPDRIQNTCQHIVDHPSPSLSRSPYHPNAMHHHPHILQEPSRPRLQKSAPSQFHPRFPRHHPSPLNHQDIKHEHGQQNLTPLETHSHFYRMPQNIHIPETPHSFIPHLPTSLLHSP